MLAAAAACGCGATSLRVSGSPTLDTGSHIGFEILGSLGVGMPLDYKGRSHHYFQVRGTLGGGMDGLAKDATVIAGAEGDYIYWPESAVDLRFGLQGLYRKVPNAPAGNEGGSFGAHLGVYPIVLQDASGWMVSQLVIGPEVRIEYVGMGTTNSNRAQLSVPLVVEVNLLGAGD